MRWRESSIDYFPRRGTRMFPPKYVVKCERHNGSAALIASAAPDRYYLPCRFAVFTDSSGAAPVSTIIVEITDDARIRWLTEHERYDAGLTRPLLRWAVYRIEQGLRDGSVDLSPPRQTVRIGIADYEFLQTSAETKNCEYQVREGRDLFCAASHIGDDAHVGTVGLNLWRRLLHRSASDAICPTTACCALISRIRRSRKRAACTDN